MNATYNTLNLMYKDKKVTVEQIMAAVKGRHITDDNAKTILGDKYPTKPETTGKSKSSTAEKKQPANRARAKK